MLIGSEEEREDVKRLYTECKGNVLDITERLYCANILEDEERVQEIIRDLVAKKEVKEIPQKGNEADRKKRLKRVRN
jgi:DnaJ family protein C protein 9